MAYDSSIPEIDDKLRSEAETILGSQGMTMRDAYRLMVFYIVREQGLPFADFRPNAQTMEAMRAAERRETESFSSIDELMADLDDED